MPAPGQWIGQVWRPDDPRLYAQPPIGATLGAPGLVPPLGTLPVTQPEMPPEAPSPAPLVVPSTQSVLAPEQPGDIQLEPTAPAPIPAVDAISGAAAAPELRDPYAAPAPAVTPAIAPAEPAVATPPVPAPVSEAAAPAAPPLPDGVQMVRTMWGEFPATATGEIFVPGAANLSPQARAGLNDPLIRRAVAAEVQAKNREAAANTPLAYQERLDAIERQRAQAAAHFDAANASVAKADADLIAKAREAHAAARKKEVDFDVTSPERPAWKKALGLISIALSGIGMALNRQTGPNPAVQVLFQMADQEARERQVQYQRLINNTATAKTALDEALLDAKSGAEVLSRSRAAALEGYAQMAERVLAGAKSEQEKIAGANVIAELRQKAAVDDEKAIQDRTQNIRESANVQSQIDQRYAAIENASAQLELERRRVELAERKAAGAGGAKPVTPEQAYRRAEAQGKLDALALTDPQSKGFKLADGTVSYAFIDGATGQPIRVDPERAKDLSLSATAATEINSYIGQQQQLIKLLGASDYALNKAGGKTAIVRKIEQLQTAMVLAGNNAVKGGSMDAGLVTEMEKLQGGKATDWLHESSVLDNLRNIMETRVRARMEGTGAFNGLDPDGKPHVFRLPLPSEENKAVDPTLDRLLQRDYGKRAAREWRGGGSGSRGESRDPDVGRALRDVRDKDTSLDAEAKRDLYRRVSNGDAEATRYLIEIARDAPSPQAKKDARGIITTLLSDQWAMSASTRAALKELLAKEKGIQTGEWLSNAQ